MAALWEHTGGEAEKMQEFRGETVAIVQREMRHARMVVLSSQISAHPSVGSQGGQSFLDYHVAADESTDPREVT